MSRKAQRYGFEALETREVLTTFFVASTGNNQAAGSADAPWQTLQHAADRVQAGDIVIVRAGEYAGFDLRTDGRADAAITFQAEAGAKITSRNYRTPDGINLEGADHIVIDGFTINGMARAGIRSVTNHHVTIRNNSLDSNNYWGIFTGFSDDVLIENNVTSRSLREHGIYVSNSGDRPIIRNNIIWGNRNSGIHMNGDLSTGGDGTITGALVEGNTIYENGVGGGSGINADGVEFSLFQNNVLYANHASGISLYQIDGAHGSWNNTIVNNTISMASNSRWAVNIQNGSTGTQLYNNILFNDHSWRGSIDISTDSLSGFRSDYNVLMNRMTTDGGAYVQNLDQWRSATGQDQHSLVSASSLIFANPLAFDFHLLAGSAAIDRGTSQLAPAKDHDGNVRYAGLGYDIGAYELIVGLPVNRAPVAASDSATVTQNQSVTFNALANDSDPDGDVLSVLQYSQAAHGVVAYLGDGVFRYTPVQGYSGADEFTYTVADGKGGAAVASVTLSVLAIPQEPPPDPTDPTAVQVLYRINAGGAALPGDPSWQADNGSGSPYHNADADGSFAYATPVSINMGNVSVPVGTPEAIFQSERYDRLSGDEMSWSFAVDPGAYTVRLYFAETYSDTQRVGARVFDVLLEGATVLDHYDIFADVGGNAAVVKTFTVNSDSSLDIEFRHLIENPAIKGIEILRLTTPEEPSEPLPANQLVASTSSVQFDKTVVGGTTTALVQLTNTGPNANSVITIDTSSIRLTGMNPADFSFALPTQGIVSLASGQMTTVTLAFNPHVSEATIRSAVLEIIHSASATPLSITLSGEAEQPAPQPEPEPEPEPELPTTGTTLYRINAGGSSLGGDVAWQADNGAFHNGDSADSVGYSVSNRIDLSHASLHPGTPEALFQSERYDRSSGSEMQWNFAVAPGQYEVRLYFAEVYDGAQFAGARVFDVSIEGQLVLNDYDIFADVGGYRGVAKTFVVSSDSNLDIDFGHVRENPSIKGIEIVSLGASGLRAAEGVATSGGATLTQADLPALVTEAIARWTSVGADTSALNGLQFVVTDLPGDLLGLANNGLIQLDFNAAGHGWFLDATPGDDVEFTLEVGPAGMDLLTVLHHEIGHALGLDDLAADTIDNVMADRLSTGVRHAPTVEDVDALFAVDAFGDSLVLLEEGLLS